MSEKSEESGSRQRESQAVMIKKGSEYSVGSGSRQSEGQAVMIKHNVIGTGSEYPVVPGSRQREGQAVIMKHNDKIQCQRNGICVPSSIRIQKKRGPGIKEQTIKTIFR